MEQDADSALPAEPSQHARDSSAAKDAPAPSLRTPALPPQASGAESHWLVLKAAERFWYVVQCLWFGAGYFSKLPTKRALCDAGVVQMTSAENFWYVLECLAFGSGYLAKVPMKRALFDAGVVQMTSAENFWYVLECLDLGAGYLAKAIHKKALSEAPERLVPSRGTR